MTLSIGFFDRAEKLGLSGRFLGQRHSPRWFCRAHARLDMPLHMELPHQLAPFRGHRAALVIPAVPVEDILHIRALAFDGD